MLQVVAIHSKFSTCFLLNCFCALLEIYGLEKYFGGFGLLTNFSGFAVYLKIVCAWLNRLCLIGCSELMCLCWSQGCEDGCKYLSKMMVGTPDLELFGDRGLTGEDLPCHDDRLRDNLCNTIRLFSKSLPRLRSTRKNRPGPFSKSSLSLKKTVWAYFHPKMVPNKLAGGCYPKVFLLEYIFYFSVRWFDV